MEDTAPEFPPLNESQKYLLEEIAYAIAELQKEIQRLYTPPDNLNLKALSYHEGAEFFQERRLRKEIDNLTIKAIRSLWRRVPGKRGYPRICMKFIEDKEGKYQISYVPGDGIKYHPEMPRWALEHCCLWIHEKRCIRSDEIYNLLAACKMGFETGLRPPLDLDLLKRVLRLRGFDMNSEKDLKKLKKIDGIKNPNEEGPKNELGRWETLGIRLPFN